MCHARCYFALFDIGFFYHYDERFHKAYKQFTHLQGNVSWFQLVLVINSDNFDRNHMFEPWYMSSVEWPLGQGITVANPRDYNSALLNLNPVQTRTIRFLLRASYLCRQNGPESAVNNFNKICEIVIHIDFGHFPPEVFFLELPLNI